MRTTCLVNSFNYRSFVVEAVEYAFGKLARLTRLLWSMTVPPMAASNCSQNNLGVSQGSRSSAKRMADSCRVSITPFAW